MRAAFGRPPWQLTAEEFEAVAEPWFEMDAQVGWSSPRMFGLSVSMLRFGIRLRLVVLGGPEGGHVVDVDWSDEANLADARRAFVADALARGEYVPADVLKDYPDFSTPG